jgi:predicted ArsR family transcriptional regulator
MNISPDLDISRLGTLGGALGDPTRFSIYRHVIVSREPLSAGEVAEVFGLHRTVARSHLERLTEAGLLQVGTRRKPKGGRPAKVYSASDERLDIQLPPRRYDTLSTLLLRLAQRLNGQAVGLAHEVGYEFGHELAATLPRGHDDGIAIDSALALLAERGCRPRVVEVRADRIVLEVGNCLYHEVAEASPDLVCGLSAGMICGLLGIAVERHRQTASILMGDGACRHEFLLQD